MAAQSSKVGSKSIAIANSSLFGVKTMTNGKKKQFINLPGMVIVLFTLPDCKECHKVVPMFIDYSQEYAKYADFRLCDVKANMDIFRQAKGTSCELARTPTVIVYKDGNPYAINDKPSLRSDLGLLIEKVIKSETSTPMKTIPKLESSDSRKLDHGSRKPIIKSDDDNAIPYNMVCDDVNCYITEAELEEGRCENGVCDFEYPNQLD